MANADNIETAHYFTQVDAHSLFNVQPTNMSPQVRLRKNRKMDPEQVGHLTLSLPHAATETHFFSMTNAYLISVGKLYGDGCK